MVSFRSTCKLNSYLVQVNLYPLKRRVGSCKCRCIRCQVYRSIIETDRFIYNNDQRSYKINISFNCYEKCLIYLLTCNCCQKQHVGQTVEYLGTDGIIIKIMLESLIEGNTACKSICISILRYQNITVFFIMCLSRS